MMEITRYVNKETLGRFKSGILNILELIECSSNKKDGWWNIPIKIIIPDKGE